MNKSKIIFVLLIFVISATVSFAQDGESLEAKLARIDAAMAKAKQPTTKTHKIETTQTLDSATDWQAALAQPVASNYVETTDVDEEEASFWTRESPTNGFWGLNDKLADKGIEVGAGLTTLYQKNVKGGLSTHNDKGTNTGRYDVEMAVDLEKLLGIQTGSFFVHGWGGWTDSEGIDETSIGSVFGSSALGAGNRTLDIVEAFYEGSFFFDNLTIALGKMDFTGVFDASEYADDECGQFLNAAFVDDPTIPFPAQGLGIVLNWDITDTWYLMGGVIDAQGDNRETGFRTTFHDEDYFFYALETGKSIELNSARGALPGNYRVGMWVDGQDKARLSPNEQNHRDDIGVYTSNDQMLYKENGDPEDTQGLAAFLRYGWASSKYNEITKFFSAGLQYQGLIDSRDDDVIGLGFAHGTFSNDASDYTEDYESVWEVYYNAQITPWFVVGPSMQYITNPGGVDTSKDAVVVGFRAAVTF